MNLIKKSIESKMVSEAFAMNLDKKRANELIYHNKVMRTKIDTWMNDGEKTFMLSKDLVEGLINTDIPWDMCPNDFKYPFGIFMIESQIPLFQTHFPGESHPVHHILFLDVDSIINHEDTSVIDFDGVKYDRPQWDVALTGLFQSGEIGLDNIMMHMRGHETIKQSAEARKPGEMLFELDNNDIKGLVNIFFNTVLYINDPSRISSETQEEKIRSFRDQKGGKFRESKYILLKPPRTYKSLSTGRVGHKLDHRVVVRGHWWPKLSNTSSEKPRRWVMPYHKGPMTAEANRTYKVG